MRPGFRIMEPMCSAFQRDTACYEEGVDFMLGDSLLVANVVEKGLRFGASICRKENASTISIRGSVRRQADHRNSGYDREYPTVYPRRRGHTDGGKPAE